jgi:hypothetical protein
MSVNTRTPRGRLAKASSRASSPPPRLPRRPTVTSGLGRNSVCFVSTAFGVSHGSRHQVSTSQADLFRVCSPRAMDACGLAPLKGLQAAVVAAFLVLLSTLHRLRVRQLAREFNMGLEARVSERTGIARELHDTLLQSFHGLLLRFQAATNQLPDGPVKRRFEGAIDQGAQAIAEGRGPGCRAGAALVGGRDERPCRGPQRARSSAGNRCTP